MHELHIIKDLIHDLLEIGKKQKISKIKKVYIIMGKLTEINPEILKEYFKEHTKGTLAEDCTIEIRQSKTRELRLESFDYD